MHAVSAATRRSINWDLVSDALGGQFVADVLQRKQLLLHLLHIEKLGVVGVELGQGVALHIALLEVLVVVQATVVAGNTVKLTHIDGVGALLVGQQREGEKRYITFLDTPGHEAFTAMRARGAELTDVAILVVAANDGVMPQTVEALNHAKSANVPIVVAVNKIDLPDANPEKVRSQLMEFGLVPEEYGGDTMFVDVSAKDGTGIEKLLEAVLLTSDADLDLRTDPSLPARGTAVEARLDRGRGPVVSALIKEGTLRTGDAIVVGNAYGKVRAMFDEEGEPIKEAGASMPVAVLGLTSLPAAGDLLLQAPDDRIARQIAEKREALARAAELGKQRKVVSL